MIISPKALSLLLQKVLILGCLALIAFYRYMLKFVLINEGCCYAPSCSVYMQDALKNHGPFRGIFLGMRRIARCHPWRHPNTPLYDPVPPSNYTRKDTPWIQKKEI